MPLLPLFCLRAIHFLYSIFLVAWSLRKRWAQPRPGPLSEPRKQTPNHVAILLSCTDDKADDHEVHEAFFKSVEKAAACCKLAGVSCLTVFDRHNILVKRASTVRQRLQTLGSHKATGSTVVYPPTPPSSDDSDSQLSGDDLFGSTGNVVSVYPEDDDQDLPRKFGRPKSGLKRRLARRASLHTTSSLRVQAVGPAAGKMTIASTANDLACAARQAANSHEADYNVNVDDLQAILEDKLGPGAPDLLIVHNVTRPKCLRPPVELQMFPPWQIRLTEIFYDASWSLRMHLLGRVFGFWSSNIQLSEHEFCRALDEYTKVEFRVGK